MVAKQYMGKPNFVFSKLGSNTSGHYYVISIKHIRYGSDFSFKIVTLLKFKSFMLFVFSISLTSMTINSLCIRTFPNDRKKSKIGTIRGI